MKEIVAVVLGGGKGSRLFPLTKDRSKPAVPLAGRYRLIDIPLSNCINSDIRSIYVLTMYQSASLNAHVANTYRFDSFSKGFVSILAAEQTAKGGDWFQGTADAVRQAWVHIDDHASSHILVLSGDHLYRMDYRDFRAEHEKSGAEVTIAVQPVTREEAPELGILKISPTGRVINFVEKPKDAAVLDEMRSDTTALGLSTEEAAKRPYLASMGIYFFNTPVMQEVLMSDPKHTDFGKHVIPLAIKERHVQAYCFKGYWADIGTVRAFYDANMDLVRPLPQFDLFDAEMPIYTHSRPLPGAKLNRASVENSILCAGAIVDGGSVRDSIVGVRTRILRGATVEHTVVMGADYYQASGDKKPLVGIGEGSYVRRAIIDKNASIGSGAQLVNRNDVTHYDDPAQQFYVRDGIIIVVKNGVIPAGFVF
ncbi:MAG TPA: glucose-1-phosphate adenylyltransferase [Planctomycetota bacterium]|jgi:glucose-1-phosphate adenylyltransferase